LFFLLTKINIRIEYTRNKKAKGDVHNENGDCAQRLWNMGGASSLIPQNATYFGADIPPPGETTSGGNLELNSNFNAGKAKDFSGIANLTRLGLSKQAEEEALRCSGLYLGRIVSQSKQLYRAAAGGGEILAQVSGKFRKEAASPIDFPVVGDFVMLDREDDKNGDAVIHRVLTRKSLFLRKAAGTSGGSQAVAANADIVFLCMGLDDNFNIRRLERYLSIAWDSGATPVVVLTKSDLCEYAEKLALAESAAIGADVIVTNALDSGGADVLKPYIQGKTTAFIGSSGVGKSTLINALAGEELFKTAETGAKGKGRHTTTSRSLTAVCGGAVIDTPGMREIGLESADLSASFSDIDELALGCRFGNCSHTQEPGCAVLLAIEEGTLGRQRLESYLKLKKEAGYDGLDSRQIEAKKINNMFGSFSEMKNLRRQAKEKNK
jgi:ribosome biogenesis GTPase / thiamine phosphate phosphatase